MDRFIIIHSFCRLWFEVYLYVTAVEYDVIIVWLGAYVVYVNSLVLMVVCCAVPYIVYCVLATVGSEDCEWYGSS